jgi:membrane protein DedA with SNARE-associated domain
MAVAAFVVIAAVVNALTEADLGIIERDTSDFTSYFTTFALVYGDAIVAIFPGETTLNTASVLATDGELEIGLVILAGFLGAWLGDNTLYWVTRSIPALHERTEKAQEHPKVQEVLGHVNQNAMILVGVCRFLPFVRWAVVAGMGVLPMPYRRFLLADTIGCAAWAAYTCLMAYWIGNTLADYPLASVAISCASSGIILGVGYLIWRRVRPPKGEPKVATPA